MKETSQTPEFYINAYRSYAAKRRRSTEQEMKDMENFQQSMLLSSKSKLQGARACNYKKTKRN